MLFILRCGPAKRRRNSLLIHLRHAAPPADGRYHYTLHACVNVKRRRAKMTGTVGGRIAVAQHPC